ncbi:MAG: hypothetical protein EA426_04840 [Spirochaetaceae bacterium]|nr:MAG: hypothetical protein EA426_04840 [Spirochaetaceae bacterium]
MSNLSAVHHVSDKKVTRRVLTAVKRRKGDSSIADIITETGLPKSEVELAMNRIVFEYAGQLKVTESGTILYYFPNGFRNRVTGLRARARRAVARAAGLAGKVLALAFKVWIVVMLIGYFAFFVLLLLAAVVASIAVSASSKGGGSRRGGFMGFFLASRLINFFIYMYLFSGTGYRWNDSRGMYGRGHRGAVSRPAKGGRRLHNSVFAYVFGEEDTTEAFEERETRALIARIRSQKGIITTEEVMAMTGATYADANARVSRLLVEYDGVPTVTESGTLVFSFPELMKTRETIADGKFENERRPTIAFSSNNKSLNRWIGIFNGVNLGFGAYFFAYSFLVTAVTVERGLDIFFLFVLSLFFEFGAGVLFLGVVLGIVPMVFSLLFFGIPLVRRIRDSARNEEIKRANLRKTVYAEIIAHPENVIPENIRPRSELEKPKNAERVIKETVEAFAAEKSADVEEVRPGAEGKPPVFRYRFGALKRELDDVDDYRKTVDTASFEPGNVVFDSGERVPDE